MVYVEIKPYSRISVVLKRERFSKRGAVFSGGTIFSLSPTIFYFAKLEFFNGLLLLLILILDQPFELSNFNLVISMGSSCD